MASLYCILPDDESRTEGAIWLAKACESQGIQFVVIRAATFDFAQQTPLEAGDMLFRLATHDSRGRLIQTQLLNPEVVTFYRSYERALGTWPASAMVHAKEGVPTPRSVWVVNNQRETLRAAAGAVGGFPLVLKVIGGSRGVGVMKMDSWASLVSLADYLYEQGATLLIREFLAVEKPAYSFRGVVLGDALLLAYRNMSMDEDDFRSNANQQARQRSLLTVDPAEEAILVKAVHSFGLELGAVDFVRTATGLKIFEVNFPFDFVPIIRDLAIPIHEILVRYLVQKSDRVKQENTWKPVQEKIRQNS